MRVIGGNGEVLDFKSFRVLFVSLGTNLLWHKFSVIPNLPLKVLIEADLLTQYLCSLQCLNENKKRLQFKVAVFASCNRFRNDPDVGCAAQLLFVVRVPRRKQNRLKVGYNFLATLHEKQCAAILTMRRTCESK